MASSRKVGTNEEVATYGTGKTYTSLATWEADTDIDLVTATKSCVLEIYGNSYNDGNCTLSGATTNTSYFRIVRPASGNKLTSGAISTKHFTYTADSASEFITLSEPNCEVQDIVATRTVNYNTASANTFAILITSGGNCGFVGCVAINCSNAYSGRTTEGFTSYSDDAEVYFKNCLAHNCDGSGFELTAASNGKSYAYNCTSIGNALYGFTGGITSNNYAYGCGADGNSSGDLDTTYVTFTNCSDSTPTFAAGTDNFHLGAADTVWKDADTNTGSWHSSCGYDDDVDGDTRTGSWDIGWDEVTGGGATVKPHHYYLQQ